MIAAIKKLFNEDWRADPQNIFIIHLIVGITSVLAIFSFECSTLFHNKVWLLGFIPFVLIWILFWRNVAYFFVRYGRYLYISIFYFLILGIALSLFEQTETLFARLVEDESAWNFIVFAVQFPLSIIIVWFLPYYLIFSDIYYKNHLSSSEVRQLPRSVLLLNVFLPVRMIFSLINEEERKKLKERFDEFNKDSKEDHWLFHRVRRVLGAGYICVLCNLLGNVSQAVGDDTLVAKFSLTTGGIIIMLFYFLVDFHDGSISNAVAKDPIEEDENDSADAQVKSFDFFAWIEKKGMKIPLAFLLIFILFSLFSGWRLEIYDKLYSLFNILMFVGLILVSILLFFVARRLNSSEKEAAGNDDTEPNAIVSGTVSNWKSYVLPSITLLFVVLGFVSLGILVYLISSGQQALDLGYRIRWFSAASFFLLVAFMGLAYLRRKSRYWEINNSFFRFLIQILDKPGTSIIMAWNMGLVILFFASFIATLFQFEKLFAYGAENLNPLNLFFIFINGLVALLAFFDRAIVLLMRSLSARRTEVKVDKRRKLRIFRPYSISPFLENQKDTSSAGKTAEPDKNDGNYAKVELNFIYKAKLRMTLHITLIALVIACIIVNRYAGDYHTLEYRKNANQEPVKLEAYVRKFLDDRELNQRENCPIYIIAADGGGLKAAYWTTRLLHTLEKEANDNFQFQHDVFAASGASGGSVGLGLYTYMYADQDISLDEIDNRVKALGNYNFLSTDFGGLMTRWPLKFVPFQSMAQCADRMDVMGRNYFGTTSSGNDPDSLDIHTDPVFTNGYSYLWKNRNSQLPLFITNTARVEDGSKGIMHPLHPEDASKIFGGMMDLTYKNLDENYKITNSTTSISFPDALMTTNRFPVFSPMAKINGRGHFVDAGAVDNSGKGTILQLLQYMREKSLESGSNVYKKFFDNDIVLISIRCDKQRYFYETFKHFATQMERTDQEYYLPSFLNGTISTGLTGNPRSFEGLLEEETHLKVYGLDTRVINLSIPFYVESIEEVFEVLGSYAKKGTDVYQAIQDSIISSNQFLEKELNCESDKGASRPPFLEPPLARILSQTSILYMEKIAQSRTEYFSNIIEQTFSPPK